MEHHSNIIPWQQVVKATGATLKYFHFKKMERFDLYAVKKDYRSKTKIVAIMQISNVLGVH